MITKNVNRIFLFLPRLVDWVIPLTLPFFIIVYLFLRPFSEDIILILSYVFLTSLSIFIYCYLDKKNILKSIVDSFVILFKGFFSCCLIIAVGALSALTVMSVFFVVFNLFSYFILSLR